MIIWSRWGFLSFLAIGASVAVFLPTLSMLGLPEQGTYVGATIFTLTAAFNAALARWAYPRLDKPRALTFTRPLPQPYRLPNGTVQTHEVLPMLDPHGDQVWEARQSTLFFIPAKYFWAIFGAVALVLWVVTIVQAATGG